MKIVVESRQKLQATLEQIYPGAAILDVTSNGPDPWVRFSPLYPHGGIPIPNSSGKCAESVEGLWQGLKVFENADIDPEKWQITNMKGIERTSRSLGAVRGHQFGINSTDVLDCREARVMIYLPAYLWVLQNRLTADVAELEKMGQDIVLLDDETNGDIDDLSKPLSHASLVKRFVEGSWLLICQRCDSEYETVKQTWRCPRCKALPTTVDERRQIEEAVRKRMGDAGEPLIQTAISMTVALYDTDSGKDKGLATLLPGYVQHVAAMKRVE